jgi:two-component system osmolarity sensor histidine kinase EnvZ
LDAFLDFARSDAGDNLEPTVPSTLVNAVLEDAKRMNQPVSLGAIEGHDEPVSLRPFAIRRALDNLVGNALRYGNKAEIGVTVTDRAIRFWVEDDGPGIPPERYDDALSPFVRLDPARNQDKGSGVGLGLSIVADIARTHGGLLRLGESEKLGGLKAEVVLAR